MKKLLQDKVTVMQASYGSVAVLLAIASAFGGPMVFGFMTLFGVAAIVVAALAILSGELVHGALAIVLAIYIATMSGGMMPM